MQVEKPEPTKMVSDPFKMGGVEGLSQLMAIKTRNGLKSFEKHTGEIIAIVQAEMKLKAQGKRIVKEQVFDEIKMLARFACAELCNLALPVAPNPAVLVRIEQASSFPKTSDWERVRKILEKLSIKEHWPAAVALPDWFKLEILPALQWSIAKVDPGSLELTPVVAKPTEVKPTALMTITPRLRNDIEGFGHAFDRAYTAIEKGTARHVN